VELVKGRVVCVSLILPSSKAEGRRKRFAGFIPLPRLLEDKKRYLR
jgi:hypothetical protein